MKRLSSIVLICSLVVVFAEVVSAKDRKSLQGLNGINVLIEEIDSDAVKDGLNKDDLQTLVELQLRKSDIKVLTKEESFREEGMPYLYLTVNAMKRSDGFYLVNIRLSLEQQVALTRNPKIEVVASTWGTGTIMSVGWNRMVSAVRYAIGERLDSFINDYLAVNPK